jgi:MFS family permease
MFIKRRFWRLRAQFRNYSTNFWVLILATFVDRLGGAILFPFFTLYITTKFEVGMTTVGVLFGVFSITSLIGNTIGGALTDRLGRKSMLIFGLVMSAVSSLWMGLVDELQLFFLGAVVVGLFANVGGPAQQAMVADLLPEEQRAEGFAILRITANLAVAIGPAIGGFLAAINYLYLFVTDAVTSTIVAIGIFFILPETAIILKGRKRESMAQTFGGYSKPLTDGFFLLFMLASTLMGIVYIQMNSTLAVYLRDIHSINERGFGWIMTLNASMVVFLQYATTRRMRGRDDFKVMAAGTLLYALGFSMYGFVSDYSLFLFAMVIITIGEMMIAPVTQATVARIAPATMRGRYMAVYSYTWIVSGAVGPYLAGLIFDAPSIASQWVWYAAGLVGLASAGLFLFLPIYESRRAEAQPLSAD